MVLAVVMSQVVARWAWALPPVVLEDLCLQWPLPHLAACLVNGFTSFASHLLEQLNELCGNERLLILQLQQVALSMQSGGCDFDFFA